MNPNDKHDNEPNHPDDLIRLAIDNESMIAFFNREGPIWSARLQVLMKDGDAFGMKALAEELRPHATAVSRWNIACGDRAHPDLLKVESYLEETAREIERAIARPPEQEDNDPSDDWKLDN